MGASVAVEWLAYRSLHRVLPAVVPMSRFFPGVESVDVAVYIFRFGIALAGAMAAAVVLERVGYGFQVLRRRHLKRQYSPFIRRVLAGDETATSKLALCPPRHRLIVAEFLISPLIDDRDPVRIA